MIISRRVRWVRHEACMGQKVDVGFCWEIPTEKKRWEDLDFDGIIIRKRILKREFGSWMGFM